MADDIMRPSFSMSRPFLDAIDAARRKRDMNRSQAARDAFRLWLRVNGEEVPTPGADKKAS